MLQDWLRDYACLYQENYDEEQKSKKLRQRASLASKQTEQESDFMQESERSVLVSIYSRSVFDGRGLLVFVRKRFRLTRIARSCVKKNREEQACDMSRH